MITVCQEYDEEWDDEFIDEDEDVEYQDMSEDADEYDMSENIDEDIDEDAEWDIDDIARKNIIAGFRYDTVGNTNINNM